MKNEKANTENLNQDPPTQTTSWSNPYISTHAASALISYILKNTH